MIIHLSSFCTLVLLAVVPAAPQQQSNPADQPCPSISVSCPSELALGDPITFTANITGGDPSLKPVYNWEVSAGRIIEGQGSSSIKVDTSGLGGQAPTATVTIGGLDSSCSFKTASCSLIVENLPNSVLFDSYGSLPTKAEQRRLDELAVQLQTEPWVQAYVHVYGGRRSHAGEIKKVEARSQEYLVQSHGIDPSRIITVDAGYKESLTVDLWLVPPGANPPAAKPTVDSSEVTLIRTKKTKSSRH